MEDKEVAEAVEAVPSPQQSKMQSFKERAVKALDSMREKAKTISDAAAPKKGEAEVEAAPAKPASPAVERMKAQAHQLAQKADAVPGVPFVKEQWGIDRLQVVKVGLYAWETFFALLQFATAAAALDSLKTMITKVEKGRSSPLKLRLAQSWPFIAPRGVPTGMYMAEDSLGFVVAAGVMAFIFGGLLCFATTRQLWRRNTGKHFVSVLEMGVCALMALFMLSGGAALAAKGTCPPGSSFCNNYNAGQAFSWITWLMWTASMLIALLEWLRGPKPVPVDEEAPEAAARATVTPMPSHIKAVNIVRTNSTGSLTKSGSATKLNMIATSGTQTEVELVAGTTDAKARIADLEQQIGATKSALVRADLERKLAKEMVLVEEAEAKMRVGGNMPHSGSRSELDRARSGSGSLPRSSSRSELERARSGGGDRSRSSHREREQRSSSRHRDYEREHRSSSRSRYEAHGMSRTSSRDEMHRSSSRNDMQRTSSRDEMHRSSSRNDMQRTGSSGSLSKSQRTQQAERANSAASGSGSGGSGNAGLANGHPVTMKKFLQDI